MFGVCMRIFLAKMLKSPLHCFYQERKFFSPCKHRNQNNNYWVTAALDQLQIIYKCQDSNTLALIFTHSTFKFLRNF